MSEFSEGMVEAAEHMSVATALRLAVHGTPTFHAIATLLGEINLEALPEDTTERVQGAYDAAMAGLMGSKALAKDLGVAAAPDSRGKPDPTRDVRAVAVLSPLDGSCRGWVRLDHDRVGHPNQTAFCITIDSSSYLDPSEARAFAEALIHQANQAEAALHVGEVEDSSVSHERGVGLTANPDARADQGLVAESDVQYWARLATKWSTERNAWVRLFNRLDAAVAKRLKAGECGWMDDADDALRAAHDRILKSAAEMGYVPEVLGPPADQPEDARSNPKDESVGGV